jgi:hypothetical protein
LGYRRYLPSIRAIGQTWFNTPIQQIPITLSGTFSSTADGACQAYLGDGTVVYAKPRPGTANNILLGREKVAADLGHLLELPVAPVVIREPGASWSDHSMLSLACLPAGRLWSSGGIAHSPVAAPELEALRVFWTWIGDSDHGGHGENLLYQVDAAGCSLAAIDHAHSLCHGNSVDPLTVGECGGYGTKALPEAASPCTATADKILLLDWAQVQQVVNRLGAILTVQEQDRIINILRTRRDGLKRLLGI